MCIRDSQQHPAAPHPHLVPDAMERVRRMGKPYRPKDHYFQRAKQRGFRARSAFKLEELAQRFGLLRPGARVLDLGAAPGGFLQVIAREVGSSGLAVGVDLVPLRPFSEQWVRTAVLDVLADDAREQLEAVAAGPYDAVLSDMAPKTTGVRATAEARSLRLAERALELARALGRPGSSFVTKLFMGCLLYTSDAADERSSVDLGGRRII